MKTILAISIGLIATRLMSQELEMPVHDLKELPTILGMPDALHGDVTKENQEARELPFVLAIKESGSTISVELSVVSTNKLAALADVFLYKKFSLWMPLSPMNRTNENATYVFTLPRALAEKTFIILACSKNVGDFPNLRPEEFLRVVYKDVHRIRLGSYIPEEAIHTPVSPTEISPTETLININIH